jgi:cardiolipin synthase
MMSPDHRNLLAMVIFVLAALTDWFDGYLARKLNQTSAFGAFLDPVADKLMVTAALARARATDAAERGDCVGYRGT